MTSRLSRPSTRAFVVAALVVTLALAGLASYYASDSPDGLSRVAADHGLAGKQRASATDDSPLAGYQTGDDDGRLGGGLAGVVGVAVVLAFAGGLVYVVRRRAGAPADQD